MNTVEAIVILNGLLIALEKFANPNNALYAFKYVIYALEFSSFTQSVAEIAQAVQRIYIWRDAYNFTYILGSLTKINLQLVLHGFPQMIMDAYRGS